MSAPPSRTASPAARLVTIAASAGGIDALRAILAALPPSLQAAIAIVQHRSPIQGRPDLLVEVLSRDTELDVKEAAEGETVRAGVVYIAPADKHLEITPTRRFHLRDGPRVRHVKSSANPLFASAASVYGPDLLAVVLTGYLRDGTDGVQAVAAAHGFVIAQEPSDAFIPQMPESAIATGAVSAVLPLASIGAEIVRRVGG